jgi:hypothetical protein
MTCLNEGWLGRVRNRISPLTRETQRRMEKPGFYYSAFSLFSASNDKNSNAKFAARIEVILL